MLKTFFKLLTPCNWKKGATNSYKSARKKLIKNLKKKEMCGLTWFIFVFYTCNESLLNVMYGYNAKN